MLPGSHFLLPQTLLDFLPECSQADARTHTHALQVCLFDGPSKKSQTLRFPLIGGATVCTATQGQ